MVERHYCFFPFWGKGGLNRKNEGKGKKIWEMIIHLLGLAFLLKGGYFSESTYYDLFPLIVFYEPFYYFFSSLIIGVATCSISSGEFNSIIVHSSSFSPTFLLEMLIPFVSFASL